MSSHRAGSRPAACSTIEGWPDRSALEGDLLLATGLVHWIQIVGEAARLVSGGLKERHPEVPWRQIEGMRHRIVHDYTEIDVDVVWDVIESSIPELIPKLESILSEVKGGAT